MKTIKSILLACTLVLLLASCGGSYYVAERPAPYIYSRPVAPYAGAIWIEPEYVWRGGAYVATRLLEPATTKLQLSSRSLEPYQPRPYLDAWRMAFSPIKLKCCLH